MEENFDWDHFEQVSEIIKKGELFENSPMAFNIVKSTINTDIEKYNIEKYKKHLHFIYDENVDGLFDVLLYIEYLEYIIYLKGVLRFMLLGISHGDFKISDTISICNIPEFNFRVLPQLKFTENVKYRILEGGSLYFEKYNEAPQGKKQLLTYNVDINGFNILDIALFINDVKLLDEVHGMGINTFHDNTFTFPYINWGECTVKKVSLSGTYSEYLKSKEGNKAQTQRNNNECRGIYNSLTGEYVKPQNGTFYIDDFL